VLLYIVKLAYNFNSSDMYLTGTLYNY